MQKMVQSEVIKRYKAVANRMLHLSFPSLSSVELDEALDYSIIKRCKNSDVIIENNYQNKNIDSNLLEMAEYILTREPINL